MIPVKGHFADGDQRLEPTQIFQGLYNDGTYFDIRIIKQKIIIIVDKPVHPPPMLAKHCLGRIFHVELLPSVI
jgi:hypothetical protein